MSWVSIIAWSIATKFRLRQVCWRLQQYRLVEAVDRTSALRNQRMIGVGIISPIAIAASHMDRSVISGTFAAAAKAPAVCR